MYPIAVREAVFVAYAQGKSLRELASVSGIPLRTLHEFKRKDSWDVKRAEIVSRALIEESKMSYELMVLRQNFIQVKTMLDFHLRTVVDKMQRKKQTSFRGVVRAVKLMTRLTVLIHQMGGESSE